MGYFGYELKVEAECKAKQTYIAPPPHNSTEPDAALILAQRFIAFDHLTNDVVLMCLLPDEHETDTLAHKVCTLSHLHYTLNSLCLHIYI